MYSAENRKRNIALRASVVFACTLLVAACSKDAPKSDSADESPAAPVQVAPAARQSIRNIVQAESVLFPVRQANVTPKVNAPVQRFLAGRGDHVREGQLLATLEDRDLVAAAQESKQLYMQAQAAYETTKAATMPDDLVKARTDAQSAREGLDAARTLYDNRVSLLRQGAIAQKLVDDAKVALVQAQSQEATAAQHLQSLQTVGRPEQLKSAEAQMEAAKAHYESAAAQVSYSEVRSPIAGVVADRPINIGEMASSGSALFSIVDVSRVVARINVPVREAADIHVGRPASIATAAGALPGKVTVVSPAVDPNTTTVQVWVEAVNKGERLKPGVTAQISMDIGEIPNAIVVPGSALLASDEGGEKVMIAGSDGLAHESKVKVGVRNGDDVQILSGVKAGDKVITEGGLGLDDKAKIQIASPGEGDEKTGETADKGDKADAKEKASADEK